MRLYSPSNSGVVTFRLLVVVGGKYDVCLVSPILRGFWYIWTQVSCNCENPPLQPLPSFLSFVLSELISPAPSVTISSNLHQLSPDSPTKPSCEPYPRSPLFSKCPAFDWRKSPDDDSNIPTQSPGHQLFDALRSRVWVPTKSRTSYAVWGHPSECSF